MIRSSLCLALLLFGCSSNPPATSNAEAPDGGGDAAAADAGYCRSLAADPTCGKLAWATSPTKSRLRNHHFSTIVETKSGPFLYVAGGAEGQATLGDVDIAPLGADGSIGAWTKGPALIQPVGGMTGGVISNVIVIAGGMGRKVTDLAYSAVIGDDGSLGAWKAAGSTHQKRMHPGSVVSGENIYVIGGFNDPNVWDDVVRASVSPDGTVSAWTPAGKMPGPRSHFGTALVDGFVYLTGGLDESALGGPPVLDTVLRATLTPDGTLAEWTEMKKLPVGVATHANFFFGGYLYVVGGITSAAHENGVWRAPINADHTLGTWEDAPKLPTARGHVHQVPILGNRVYSVAGALDFDLNSTDHIDIGTFQ